MDLSTLMVSGDSIRHNCRVKLYPDGTKEILCSDRSVFREEGWEERRNVPKKQKTSLLEQLAEIDAEIAYKKDERAGMAGEFGPDTERSRRRARAAVSDLGQCTDFCYFVTLTLDAQRIDRYSIAEIMKKMRVWLDNRVRREGLTYVLVPERHRDGAVHFHGFFNDALPVVDSGTLSNGGRPRKPRSARQRESMKASGWHVVYNLPDWSFGFSTAIELYGPRRAAVGYVCKYINKAAEKIGGRWYYSGGDLRRPQVELCDVDFGTIRNLPGGYEFSPVENINFFRVVLFPDE